MSVTVRIEEPVYSANFAEETLAFQVLPEPPPAYTTDFDQVCPNGWTLTGAWECGVPIGVGPATAFSGSQCLATTINGGYPNLQTFASATATSPAIALPTAPGLRARFRIWIDTEGATYDGVNLQVSVDGGASFAVLNDVTPAYGLTIAGQPAWGGHQGALGWQAFEADLAAYAGQSVHLRFAFQSDSSGVFPGVYLDDFSVAY